ncbi:hypothetical protein MGN70_013502 [Eutypa lata]|nr:hypothetical protein MGN70_013502 [Eutypa lata]
MDTSDASIPVFLLTMGAGGTDRSLDEPLNGIAGDEADDLDVAGLAEMTLLRASGPDTNILGHRKPKWSNVPHCDISYHLVTQLNWAWLAGPPHRVHWFGRDFPSGDETISLKSLWLVL